MANNKGLDNAWKQAYKNDPNDFAIKQDEFEYNNYYVPVENNLKKKGIDISGKNDAVKGMACSLSNWLVAEQHQKSLSILELNQQWMIKLLYQKFMITYTLST